MKLKDVIWQSRNDFDGILECEHCGFFQLMKNGYQDDNFHNRVIPAIKCLSCNKRGNEIIPEGIGDPGYQGAVPVKKIKREIEEWGPA